MLYSCLWFFLEPLVRGSDNYGFLRKLLETIKQTVDAQEPDTPEASKVRMHTLVQLLSVIFFSLFLYRISMLCVI